MTATSYSCRLPMESDRFLYR